MKISKKSLAQQVGLPEDKISRYEKCEIKLTEKRLRAILQVLHMESALIDSDIELVSKPSARMTTKGFDELIAKDVILSALSTNFFSTMRRLLIVTQLSKSAIALHMQELIDNGRVNVEYFKNDTGRGRANAAYRKIIE